MSKNTMEILQGLVGAVLLTAWIIKYVTHFNYRKAYDPTLKNVTLGSFLSTGGQFTSLKLALTAPWIIRNKAAETQVPGLSKKAMTVTLLCVLFVILMICVGILSNYAETHFGTPE
jgi:hypothetical protein